MASPCGIVAATTCSSFPAPPTTELMDVGTPPPARGSPATPGTGEQPGTPLPNQCLGPRSCPATPGTGELVSARGSSAEEADGEIARLRVLLRTQEEQLRRQDKALAEERRLCRALESQLALEREELHASSPVSRRSEGSCTNRDQARAVALELRRLLPRIEALGGLGGAPVASLLQTLPLGLPDAKLELTDISEVQREHSMHEDERSQRQRELRDAGAGPPQHAASRLAKQDSITVLHPGSQCELTDISDVQRELSQLEDEVMQQQGELREMIGRVPRHSSASVRSSAAGLGADPKLGAAAGVTTAAQVGSEHATLAEELRAPTQVTEGVPLVEEIDALERLMDALKVRNEVLEQKVRNPSIVATSPQGLP